MNHLLASTLAHLKVLVAFDTRNPPRAISTGGIFDYIRAQLPDFGITLRDHGAGAVSLFAVRGRPRYLFNVHLDTVPDSPAWTTPAHVLKLTTERAIGLGSCDIKGAAAALLTVAGISRGDMALLFTSDEEANDPRCVAAFAANRPRYEAVIVAEPTMNQVVLAHRGIQSVRVGFSGHAGHASAAQKPADSALHQALNWGHAALDYVAGYAHERFGGLTGLRFNIGYIEGGIKANMIAPDTHLRLSMRPLPTMDPDTLLAQLGNLTRPKPTQFEENFRGPSLPAGDTATAESRLLAARDIADEWAIPIGHAVDFWTEASLFSAAGYTALVYGPGDITQAHTANEWVALDQLQHYTETLHRLIDRY